jgi:hypothetical protein
MLSNFREDKNLKALDVLLKDKPDDYKGRVLEYVRAANIDADDPTFILIAAQGSLDIALEKLPIEFRGIVALAIKELRSIVALASSNTSTVLSVYSRDAESRQEETELLEEKLNALVKKQGDEIVRLTVTVEKLKQKINQLSAIENKLTQLPNRMTEAIIVANNKHDRYVVDNIMAHIDRLILNITDNIVDRLIPLKKPFYVGAVGLVSLVPLVGLSICYTNVKLSDLTAEFARNQNGILHIVKKLENDTIKLQRIEKKLGIEPTKKTTK